jgi:hypothetical protein
MFPAKAAVLPKAITANAVFFRFDIIFSTFLLLKRPF